MKHALAKSLLQEKLAVDISTAQLDRILLLSSFIRFSESQSILFKKGEYTKGFYLILSGQVLVGGQQITIDLDTVGLHAYCSKSPIVSDFQCSEELLALYIDRRCLYRSFLKSEALKLWLEKKYKFEKRALEQVQTSRVF